MRYKQTNMVFIKKKNNLNINILKGTDILKYGSLYSTGVGLKKTFSDKKA